MKRKVKKVKEMFSLTKEQLSVLTNFEKERLSFRLVNTERNKSRLEKLVSREFLDLSITYHYEIDKNAFVGVTEELLKGWNLSESELFQIAKENHQPFIQKMSDLLGELATFPIEDVGIGMEVITNKSKWNGAISMIDNEVLSQVAEKLESDLFILPSSIHECICVSADWNSIEVFKEMVKEVNVIEVAEHERLSDNVYYYNRQLGVISIADEEKTTKYA